MQQIGQYRILEQVGAGGMGVVYRAIDTVIQRTVAIKTIRMTAEGSASQAAVLRERLLREAQSAGILSHPNIVTIHQVGQHQDWTYIVMEFIEGPTLEKVLAGGGLADPGQALTILREAASALDYAHRKGIVHRDIKPANLLLHEAGFLKITDFGLARWATASTLTLTGAAVGTPHYMSPEQVQGKTVDGRSDLFALAVVAFQILTGARPFEGESLTTLVYKIVYEQPPPPQELNRSLPKEVEPVLRRALAKKPEDRYATCTEFVHALARACESGRGWRPPAPPPDVTQLYPISTSGAGISPLPSRLASPVPPASRQQPRSVRPILVAALAAVLTLAVATAVSEWVKTKIPAPAAAVTQTPEQTHAPVPPPPPANQPEPPPPTAVEPPQSSVPEQTGQPPVGGTGPGQQPPEALPAKPKPTTVAMPGRLHVEAAQQMKKALFHPAPVYPDTARTARIEGEVVLTAVIGADGTVMQLRAASGHPLLIPAALDAVERWRWEPTMVNGQRAEVETRIVVNFTLKHD